MKKIIAMVICFTMILNGFNTSCTVKASDETRIENKESDSEPSAKPSLEIFDEEDDLSKVMRRRTAKTKSEPIRPEQKIISIVQENNGAETDESKQSAQERSGDKEPPSNDRKDYTVMIYVVGSDLESRSGAATMDIEEMLGAGVNYDKTNLLLYTGGSRRWVSNIPNDKNSVLKLSGDEENRIIAQTGESVNMGQPETLSEFINYCTLNYPAEHYALILWDHGGGPLWGYGSDELFGYDGLNFEEFRAAMDETEFGPDKKLDWVGFDACLMGSIENVCLWKDYARYLIASEEVEAGNGWDYHFLNTLNDSQDPESIVKSVVDSFEKYYESNKSTFFSPEATLSVIDLSKTDLVVDSVNALFTVMEQGIHKGDYAKIKHARSRTKEFGLGAVKTIYESYDLVDLKDFTDQLKDFYPDECTKVSKAIEQAVTYSASNVDRACGISIYVPGNNSELYDSSSELAGENASISDEYKAFVETYSEKWLSGSTLIWDLPEIKEGDGELKIELTQEQKEEVSEAYYTVLRKKGSRYALSLMFVPIEVDENGVLHIPNDPLLPSVESDTYTSAAPWGCVQIDKIDGVNIYTTFNTVASPGSQFYDLDPELDKRLKIKFRNIDGEEQTEILDVVSEAGGAWNNGKESVDLSEYSSIDDWGGSIFKEPSHDEDGSLKPFILWESYNGWSMSMKPVPVDNSFKFVMRPASEFDETFSCQVLIKDIHNGIHTTECKDFPKVNKKKIIEEKTQSGTIQYELLEDHAEVISYEGEDETIEIASTISGKKVTHIADQGINYAEMDDVKNICLKKVVLPDSITEIGSESMMHLESVVLPDGLKKIGSFAFGEYLSEKIDIPDTVESIGTEAFSSSRLEKVELPSSLKRLSAVPFYDCKNLKEIQIKNSNPYYKSVDGVLYTKDGKTLIEYPHGKGNHYVVENGTERIAFGAFAEDFSDPRLQKIEFPETLKKIDNLAFYHCEQIKELTFPDSLEEIGILAFGTISRPLNPSLINKIELGANVKKIGTRAFTALTVKEFDVDLKNSKYASVDGFITNVSKDTILMAPDYNDVITVPEGITTLSSNVFTYDAMGFKEYIIPDSVYRFAKEAFGDQFDYSEIVIHCSEESAAEAYAKKLGITYDNDISGDTTKKDEENSGVIEKEAIGNITATWRLYSDHAELEQLVSDYECDEFEIPSEYKELPVTVLGSREIINVRSYDDSVFIQNLLIPDSIQEINSNFFTLMEGLQLIEVSEENTEFKSMDGVVYSADGSELIMYPREKTDREYSILEGTKNIGEGAFQHSHNTVKIVFPDSLTEVGNGAFQFCYNLSTIEFNEGLKKIDGDVFLGTELKKVVLPSSLETIEGHAFELNEEFGEIILPDNLKYMDFAAFSTMDTQFSQECLKIPKKLKFDPFSISGVLISRFDVDENNQYHTVKDGVLFSKDGEKLIAVPGQREGRFDVPEGVKSIETGAFENCCFLTDIYLPSSLEEVPCDLGVGVINPVTYTLHCYKGSVARKELDKMGVKWEEIE